MFRSYSQLLWMTLADSVNFTHMWTGVWRYAIRAFPPLFLTAWFADSLGMIPQNEYHSYIVPEEEDDEE